MSQRKLLKEGSDTARTNDSPIKTDINNFVDHGRDSQYGKYDRLGTIASEVDRKSTVKQPDPDAENKYQQSKDKELYESNDKIEMAVVKNQQ